MKTINRKNSPRLTLAQIDTLRMLETEEKFKQSVLEFRKKFKVNTLNGSMDLKDKGVLEIMNEVSDYLHNLSDKFNIPYSIARSQIVVYMKYGKWAFDPLFDKKFIEPSLGTPQSWNVVNKPIARMDKEGNVVEYSKTVSLVTSAVLSNEEMGDALRALKSLQKEVLDPRLTGQKRSKRKLTKHLYIKEKMTARSPKKTEVKPVSVYSTTIENNYKNGKLSDGEYKRAKKLNPNAFKKVKVGQSSSDIAKKHLGGKKYASNARKITSRLKKDLKEKFT